MLVFDIAYFRFHLIIGLFIIIIIFTVCNNQLYQNYTCVDIIISRIKKLQLGCIFPCMSISKHCIETIICEYILINSSSEKMITVITT